MIYAAHKFVVVEKQLDEHLNIRKESAAEAAAFKSAPTPQGVKGMPVVMSGPQVLPSGS